MSWSRTFADSVRDLARAGPGFWIGGIATRFGSSRLRVRLPGGASAVIRRRDSDYATLRQVFRDGEYEIGNPPFEDRIRRRYGEIVASGDVPVIVDAGANIGAASIWFKRKFPAAAIVAVEPDRDNVRLLRENVAFAHDVIAVEAAIGSTSGYVRVDNPGLSWAAQTTRADDGCPVITIADAAAMVSGGQLFIVKIDIEGFESDLFANNTHWIDDAFALYLEPHDWMLAGRASSRTFQAEMGRRDFDLLLRGENLVYVRREVPPPAP